MAYFDDTGNASFHSIPDTSGELDSYPSLGGLGQTSAAEEVNYYIYTTFPDRWNMGRQAGPMVGPATSHWASAGCDLVAPTTSYATRDKGYGQLQHPGHYWPAAGQQAPYHHPGLSNWGVPLANAAVPEALIVEPTPSTPFDYWGGNESGPSTGASYVEDAQAFYQPSTGPIRTGPMPTGRQPYGMSNARSNHHGNIEAGPSTPVLPPVSYISLPTQQPSGGRSKTTADAENDQKITEEDRVTKPKRTRLPRGQGRARPSRVVSRGNGHKLCDWVQRRKKLPGPPTFNDALAFAVEIISKDRPAVYLEPRLKKGRVRRTTKGSKSAENERERRSVERGLYRELSRYYPLGQNQKVWHCPPLLLRALTDLERLPALPEPSSGSPP